MGRRAGRARAACVVAAVVADGGRARTDADRRARGGGRGRSCRGPEVARGSGARLRRRRGRLLLAPGGADRRRPGRPATNGALLGALIDVVTTLDPWVDHPYRFAAVWLIDSEESVRKANELLRRGIAHHPDDWRNRFYLGFNHFYYLGRARRRRPRRSSRRMDLPGAPLYLRRLVARLQERRGRPRRRRVLPPRPAARRPRTSRRGPSTRRRSTRSRTERVARVLDEARDRYRSAPRPRHRGRRGPGAGADPVLAALPRGAPRRLAGRSSRAPGRSSRTWYGHRYEREDRPGERDAGRGLPPPEGSRAACGESRRRADESGGTARRLGAGRGEGLSARLRRAPQARARRHQLLGAPRARSSASSARTAPARRRR